MWGRFDSRSRESHRHRPGGLSQISTFGRLGRAKQRLDL